MPSTFLVDLSEDYTLSNNPVVEEDVEPHHFGRKSLETLVVAIAQPPISSDSLSTKEFKITELATRDKLRLWAVAALKCAVAKKADLIIFPELFMVGEALPEVRQLASEYKIAVISGMEGIFLDGVYHNCAMVAIPESSREYRQYKKYPSGYEPENMRSRGGQQSFIKSTVGSFAVVICSDLREFDIIRAIEGQPFLDYIVVCCCNPYPDVWKHLAAADAARLHCYVIVSNWGKMIGNRGFGTGSCVMGPCLKPELPVEFEEVLGNCDKGGSLIVCSLNLMALFRDRTKPEKDYLPAPRRRLTH
jgi:predicted amidohydrolase